MRPSSESSALRSIFKSSDIYLGYISGHFRDVDKLACPRLLIATLSRHTSQLRQECIRIMNGSAAENNSAPRTINLGHFGCFFVCDTADDKNDDLTWRSIWDVSSARKVCFFQFPFLSRGACVKETSLNSEAALQWKTRALPFSAASSVLMRRGTCCVNTFGAAYAHNEHIKKHFKPCTC